jgi:hypothetical protein
VPEWLPAVDDLMAGLAPGFGLVEHYIRHADRPSTAPKLLVLVGHASRRDGIGLISASFSTISADVSPNGSAAQRVASPTPDSAGWCHHQ